MRIQQMALPIQYCFSDDGETYVLDHTQLNLEDDDEIFVAEVHEPTPRSYIDAHAIIKLIQEWADEDQPHDDKPWLHDFDEHELLTTVIEGVLAKYPPNFYFTRRPVRLDYGVAKEKGLCK